MEKPALSEATKSELDRLDRKELTAALAAYLAGRRQRPDATEEEGFRKIAAFALKNLLSGA